MHDSSIVYLVFTAADSFRSRLIQRVIRDPYSHVAVLLQGASEDLSYTIDAMPEEKKVRINPWLNMGVNPGVHRHQVYPVPVLNAHAGHRWLEAQIGKPYDRRSLLGYAVNRVRPGTSLHLRTQDSWSCWPLAYGFLMACWAAHPKLHGTAIPDVTLPNKVILPEDVLAAIQRCRRSKGVNPFDQDFHVKNEAIR